PGLSVAYAFVARDTARPAPSQPVAYEDFMDRFRKELAAQAGEKEKVGKYDLVQAPRVGPTRRRPPKEPTDPVGPAGLQPDDVVAI
ncbi:MAG: hypothetical protein NWE79_00780, partial [Candidatus Bathyarchaeota archaeon]|nr:hypothetical protein [Candidatus Bathyarchaeota archaeon]